MTKTNTKKDSSQDVLSVISGKISRLTDRVEWIKGRKAEHITLLLYIVAHLLMCLAHEPWFDEAIAWLISRDSSLYEILFVAPHYEGHPSLWHLVLLPFAKGGLPYELSLNIISLVFSGTAVALFIYKAPFRRIIRILVPFTYFFFYQYSVISRPYCMMMLAFMLMAITYKERNKRPGRFVLSMWFLCLASAYGLVVSGGICIAWLAEMVSDAYKTSRNKNSENGESRGTLQIFIEDHLIKKGKVLWLLALLIYAIFIIFRIIPADDAYAVLKAEDETIMPLVLRILYMFFGMISDLFITNTYSYGTTISVSGLGFMDILPAVIIGTAVFTGLIFMAKAKKKLLLLIIPYSMLAVSMSYLYMSRHHMGIALMFFVFFTWVYFDNPSVASKDKADIHNKVKPCKKNTSKAENLDNNPKLIKRITTSFASIALAVGIFISLYWSISSSLVDVFSDYSLGRDEYLFLEKKGLLDKSMLAEWGAMPVVREGDIKTISFSGVITTLLPYMKNDTFYNSPSKAGYNYSLIHKVPSVVVTEDLINDIRNDPEPDVIIGEPDFFQIYLSSFNIAKYECVYEGCGGLIWKGVPEMSTEKIYVKNNTK